MQTKRFVLIWLAFTAVASAQNFYPKKDAVFGQVVAGGGFETIINIANRGTHPYVGTLGLFRTENDETVAWNPAVNGVAVQNGEFRVEIPSQATLTLRLTGPRLESGAAVLRSEELRLDNLIEANLIYFVREKGKVVDSVGISPSKEFFRASIPFEKFAETTLALVNGNTSGELTAEVDLTLYSGDGDMLATEPRTLSPRSHLARYLNELFTGRTLVGGRLEIASNIPIFGTALTLSDGEYSSLPLEPTPVKYGARLISVGGRVATGELALWADGVFVRGYLRIAEVDGEYFSKPEFSFVNGELEGGRLRLAFTILRDPFDGEEVTFVLGHDLFSFDSTLLSGTWTELFRSDPPLLSGTYELTRSVDP